MIRCLVMTSIALMMACHPAPAMAQLSCPLFFAGDPNMPEPAKKALAESAQDAVSPCTFPLDQPVVSIISPIIRGALGVCIFSESYGAQVDTFMLRSASACPRQDDDRYRNATGMSEGVFVGLTDLAARVSSSPNEFDSAAQSPEQLRREKSDFDPIRNAVTSTNSPRRYEFLGVSLDNDQRYQYRLEY